MTTQAEYCGPEKLRTFSSDVANRLELLEQRVEQRVADRLEEHGKAVATAVEGARTEMEAKVTYEAKLRAALVEELQEKGRVTLGKATEGAALVDRVSKLEANAEVSARVGKRNMLVVICCRGAHDIGQRSATGVRRGRAPPSSGGCTRYSRWVPSVNLAV